MTDFLDMTLPEGFRASVVPVSDPDPSYLEQEGFEARLEEFKNGDFGFVGVVLEKVCPHCDVFTVVGSLWGIEHDGTHESTNYLIDTAKDLVLDHFDRPTVERETA
ncbi:MAG: hypothetical protein KAJ42_06210 [Gemmatimonadetes bacterium]|nr:hypothetical protein [Gemmatimonadota bacterium]